MDGHKPRITRELQVRLDKRGSQGHRLLERCQRVFRRVPRSSAMPDDQQINALLPGIASQGKQPTAKIYENSPHAEMSGSSCMLTPAYSQIRMCITPCIF